MLRFEPSSYTLRAMEAEVITIACIMYFLANFCGIVGWGSQAPNPVNIFCGHGGLSEAGGYERKD